MPRKPRIYIPGVAHHVIQRGNNRQACFADESDYKAYLTYLKEGALHNGVAEHAYVLVTDHVSEYPWSSYGYNAVCLNIGLITPHREYMKLARDRESRRKAYRTLLRGRVSEKMLVRSGSARTRLGYWGTSVLKLELKRKRGYRASP
jgi:hypothetical protein